MVPPKEDWHRPIWLFQCLTYSGDSSRCHTYFPVVQLIGLQYSVLLPITTTTMPQYPATATITILTTTSPIPQMIYHHHQHPNHTHLYKKNCGNGESSCKDGKCDGCKRAILKCFHSGRDGGGSFVGAMEVVMLMVSFVMVT